MKKVMFLMLIVMMVATSVMAEGPPRDGCYICERNCMELGVPKGSWYCPPERRHGNLEDMPGGDNKPFSPLT